MRITKDWVVLGIFFILLTVLNITTVITSRDARDAASRAAKSVEQTNVNREYLSDLMETTGNCTLLTSAAVNTQEIPFTPEAISNYYKTCVQNRIS